MKIFIIKRSLHDTPNIAAEFWFFDRVVHPQFTVANQTKVRLWQKLTCNRLPSLWRSSCGLCTSSWAGTRPRSPGWLTVPVTQQTPGCWKSSGYILEGSNNTCYHKLHHTLMYKEEAVMECNTADRLKRLLCFTHLEGFCRRWQDASHSAGYSWGSEQIWRYHWDIQQTLLLRCNTVALHGLEENTIITDTS